MTATTGTQSGTQGAWAKAETAENYGSRLVPLLFEPWAEALVDAVGPRPGERVLDLACGTGVVAHKAATRVRPGGAVTGVDLNADMLALARRSTPADDGVSVAWRQADALDTGLPDGAFDIGFCQQGLQFFGDRVTALRELRRVLAPGGRVALSVWCDVRSPGFHPFEAAFERVLPAPGQAVRFLRAIFDLADPDELRRLLTAAGFRNVEVSRQTRTVRCASAHEWVEAFLGAAPLPAMATPDRDRIASEVAEELTPCVANGLAFPVAANVALAERGA
ncbi:class I SAM-dependent methyltransferase [Streptomyces sp. TRM64462]|uniref:class I SAM-dependent methyltransferase n=1 Tax=Streptomyces sp. TRM64462 TaxID=2741726 RepID=UPI001586A86D|nr:class I SAM-dependent methyltransferase [Streptomyces sp. TRM64462]